MPLDTIKDTKEHLGISNDEWKELSKKEKERLRHLSYNDLKEGAKSRKERILLGKKKEVCTNVVDEIINDIKKLLF
tara:strand:+ start:78 stop:305 length:228 start_codon:yes stop_codon:yes gene_type:complete